MAFTFSRVKVWGRERLTFADLNAEFNNILQNADPTTLSSDSPNAAAMRANTNVAPYVGGVQTESLPTTLDGEIQGLRFALLRFFAGSYWYSDPGRTLNARLNDMAGSLSFEGNTKVEAFSDSIRRGAIINPVSLSSADFDDTKLNSTNKIFGNFSYNLGAGNFLALPGTTGTHFSVNAQFRNLSAGDYIAYNPLLGISLFLDGSGFLMVTIRLASAATETTKDGGTFGGSVSRAGNANFHHASFRLSAANGGATDTTDLFFDGVSEATNGAITALLNPGQGGVWLFGAKANNPTWDHFSAMKVKPDLEAVGNWTLTGSAVQSAVANGVLTITGGATTTYVLTANVDLTAFTVETKFKSNCVGGAFGIVNVMEVSDDVHTRYLRVLLDGDQLTISDGVLTYYLRNLRDKDYHVIRVTSLGNPNPVTKVYIDGILVLSFTNASAHSAGSTFVQFGVNVIPSAVSTITSFEWFSYVGSTGAVYPPVLADATGQLGDILVTKDFISTNIVTQLVNNSVKSVYGQNSYLGITLPTELNFTQAIGASGQFTRAVTYVPCDGRTSLIMSLAGTVAAADTISFEQDQGVSDTIFRSQITAGANENIAMVTKTTLPIGLRRLNVFAGAANTFVGSFTVLRGD